MFVFLLARSVNIPSKITATASWESEYSFLIVSSLIMSLIKQKSFDIHRMMFFPLWGSFFLQPGT